MNSKPDHIIRVEDLGAFIQPREILLGNSEQELISACKAGKRSAQKRIYEIFAGKMINVCRRYVRDTEMARDLMHDGFIKVFLNIEKFKEQSSLETWITRIMINNSLDAVKKEIRRGIKVQVENVKLKDNTEQEDFDAQEQAQISLRQILDTLEELPLGYKTVLSMYVLDGFTHAEIAESLGIAEGTSKSQLAKAKRMLSTLLKERYL